MDSVKTYKHINPQIDSSSFAISKMEDIYMKKYGKTSEPHRHDYFTVIIINQAKGFHKIDFNSYTLSEKQIFFVAPGQVHQMIETDLSNGFVMTFSNQFLIENSIPLSFVSSLNLFQNYGQTPPLLPNNSQYDNIKQFAQQIFDLFHGEAQMKHLSIGAFLKLLLIECNNICSIIPIQTEKDSSADNLIRKFKDTVDQHFTNEHSTSFYANLLNISPDHLSRIVKAKLGRTAKEYIQSRIIVEAKRLIYFADLSNKEIGYALGFSEPANFSAFFKKHTQLSPSIFKKLEIKS